MNMTGRKAGTRVVITGGTHRSSHATVIRKGGDGCWVRLWRGGHEVWVDKANLEVVQPAR